MTISWDETNPSNDDLLSELGEVWCSFKSNLRAGVEPAFYFTASSVSTGQALVSSSTPGSCRVYYGTRSQVSDPARPGTLMVVSDESRLVAFGSSGSVVVGSDRMIVNQIGQSTSTFVNRYITTGVAVVAPGANKIGFGSQFANRAKGDVSVVVTPASVTSAKYTYAVYDVQSSGFSLWMSEEAGGASNASIAYRASAVAFLI